ncbi:MAG: MFS transporter [Hyphomicrobiales bacterium]|nr:MAG: MFS transporter [Hyphomicrobiales bacterium]
MSRSFLITYCGLLLSVSAFSCDITLPAFWSMHEDLKTPIEWVQAIVPVFLIFQAMGQLVFGPVSDRFGRRPVVVGGLVVYLIGAAVALTATSIWAVHLGRAAQGFGSACGIVVGRAILRDISHGPALARAMAFAMAIFALGPISAPLVGYGLVALGGWRQIFLGMSLFALCLLIGTRFLQETNAAPNPHALRRSSLIDALKRIVTHPQSRYFLLVAAIAQFSIVSFVASAPRFFKQAFDIEGLAFAVLFASTGLGIIVGQVTNSRLIGILGVQATTRVAAAVLLAVSGATTLLSLTGWLGGAAFVVLMFFFNTSFLVIMANSASLVIDPHREIAGFASSAFGFFTQMTASLLALLTMPLFQGRLLPWTATMLVIMTVIYVALSRFRPPAAQMAGAPG